MEKKIWTRPIAVVEQFMANEYVAACYDYTVHLTCAIPGTSQSRVNDGTSARSNHGICGATASFDVKGQIGYEVTNGAVNSLRPIYDIAIGEPASGNNGYSTNIGNVSGQLEAGTFKATWTSRDDEHHTGEYSHYGQAIVSGVVQSDNPNHS